MTTFKHLLLALLAMAMLSNMAEAREPQSKKRLSIHKKAQYRDVCANSESDIDQAINNVRARLLGGGDCWWDFKQGRYIVPKIDPASGLPEVSSLFAGAVWLGGIDPGNNLKLACQDYRNDAANDFWPGPLNSAGVTDGVTCAQWDQHFRVTGEEIRKHVINIANGNLNPNDIPRGVKGWPARGNEYFRDIYGFDLPNNQQGLAGFYDKGPTWGTYEPLEGDFPAIEIRGCPSGRYPDEMIFWIYNDHGGGQAHACTNGRAIQMEVQVQAFGYKTNDELNDMTFQRYKLINRATDRIDSTFFAMWVDPDLGCDEDDYIGCDSTRSLMFVYNQDQVDGNPGAVCPSGAPTYGEKVPILGIDYFRGPLGIRETYDSVSMSYYDVEYEIGMNTFMYYNRDGLGAPNGTIDPNAPQEYYNYLTGTWRDGTPLSYGGSGYNPGNPNAKRVRYAFPDSPNDPDGWNMCTANLPFGDRRTIQASGPFTLKPGAVNELIIGIPWVADIEYPCPDLEGLFQADELAQSLFDNCFEDNYGPDAPDVDWVEMNEEIIAVLTNEQGLSNNFNMVNEDFKAIDVFAPLEILTDPDPAVRETAMYRFEGYLIYQLKDENVSAKDFDNPEKGRLVYQVDVKNGIKKIYNWEKVRDPITQKLIYSPVLEVEGADQGIRHTFSIKEDKFASGNDKSLINHKKYYFAVLAYAYNNYKALDPFTHPVSGQDKSFLTGRRNVQIKTVIPRPVVDRRLNAAYGDGVVVTRLEGQGAGGNFLELDQETEKQMLEQGFDSTLTYKQGRGPINVTIFNPLEVKDGTYELVLVDDDLTNTQLADDARWELRKLPSGQVIQSEKTIQLLNEQIVREYGFSVSIAQTGEPGQQQNDLNGGIGAGITYADPAQAWLQGIPDGFGGSPLFNFVKTAALEEDEALDPKQGLSTLGNGWFVPYPLLDSDLDPDGDLFITPAWISSHNNALNSIRKDRLKLLPNVDIVFTSDKSKWSRCVVIETASPFVSGDTSVVKLQNNGNKGRQMFDTRYALSVGKTDANQDGLPDPDGAINPAVSGIPVSQQGKPVYGMSWFPGYAVDVETGRRLNIFFGENSGYSRALNPDFTGRDLLWNPTSQYTAEGLPGLWGAMLGGQHWIYVMHTNYDSCEALRRRLTPEFTSAPPLKSTQIQHIAWAGMLQVAAGFQLKSLAEGLIPTETRVQLRVDNPYQTWYNDQDGNRKTGHPRYQFTIAGNEATTLSEVEVDQALDSIKMVPNPYYGFSEYETSQFTSTVKITNLPAKCKITIYSLDGRFIRQYNRDEQYMPYQQISPAVEWDLKNSKGIPIASGVYLVHVEAPGMGQRTLKWFGIGRQYDPSGL